MVGMAVSPERASSQDVTMLETLDVTMLETLTEIADCLERMEQRMQALETFVLEAKSAVQSMPALPFMPKFKFTNGEL